MNIRYAHLVGSIPFADEETVMTQSIDHLGAHLKTLPDGEIGRKSERHQHGERLGWVQWIIERFDGSPAFRLVKEAEYEDRLGLWADYDKIPRYKVVVPADELEQHLDFGYPEYTRPSYELFKQLREKHGLKDMKFQVGVVSPLAIALFSLGPVAGLRHHKAFENRMAYECNRILDFAGDDVVFQIEVPPEVAFVARVPRPLRGLVAKRTARSITSLAGKLRSGAQIGVHLCYGDLNNKPFFTVRDVGPLVHVSNEIVNQWPGNQTLDFIHYPLAMANLPPSADRRFYEPFRRLNLPPETRFIAGFVHEELSHAEHSEILSVVEEALGRTVDVSSACGLGRRTPDVTEHIFDLTRSLVREGG